MRIKALILTILLALSATPVLASVYDFVPNNPNALDLDHWKVYGWGIDWKPQANEVITSAKLSIDNIKDMLIQMAESAE